MFSKADPSILQSKQRTVSYIVYDEADMILTQKLNKSRTIQSLHILQHHNENMQVVVVGATLPRNGISHHIHSFIHIFHCYCVMITILFIKIDEKVIIRISGFPISGIRCFD